MVCLTAIPEQTIARYVSIGGVVIAIVCGGMRALAIRGPAAETVLPPVVRAAEEPMG